MKILNYNSYISEDIDGVKLKYSSFDWDDNILHMPTVIHMDKLIDGSWVPTDVSTSEFAIVRNDKENYRLLNNNPDEAFSEFRDNGPRGDNAFLMDVKSAIESNKKGPSWNAFLNCLKEGSIFSIITARGHEPSTMRKGVEYILDNILSSNEKFIMYNNCLKHSYVFSNSDNYGRLPKNEFSKNKLISDYLDQCDFYGVSSISFSKEFGEGSASNPEHAKQLALDKFIKKCNSFGNIIGAKSVSVGFSDDDPKNVEHIKKYFKEKSALENEFEHKLKLTLFKTTDRSIEGGEVTKFIESSIPCIDNSVITFSQFNNIGSKLSNGSKLNDPITTSNQLKVNHIINQSKEIFNKRKKLKKGRK